MGFEIDTGAIAARATTIKGIADQLRAMSSVTTALANLTTSMPNSETADNASGPSNQARQQLEAILALADNLATGLATTAANYDGVDSSAAAALSIPAA